VPSASSIGEQLGKTIETVPSRMKLAGLATEPAVTTTPLGSAQRSHRREGPPLPPLKGSVGRGAKNDVADVRQFQQLLNLAVDNEELTGPKIPEDGKITDRMLEMIDHYQQLKKLPRQQVIDRNSSTIRTLAQNRLWDSRWSQYDDIIKKEVDYYNKLFQQKYPQGFHPLDWRRVKAMLWTEVEGPDVRDPADWYVWPMRMGKKKADRAAMDAIKFGKENTYRYVPKELSNELKHQRMTGELNVRAGIAYLYDRGIESWQTEIDDPTVHTYQLRPGETIEAIAKPLGTTVAELMQQNGVNKKTARTLRAGQVLKFRLAHEVPRWRDWPETSKLYNATGDPQYSNKVERNYRIIQRRW
jgi:LysM repeat protein